MHHDPVMQRVVTSINNVCNTVVSVVMKAILRQLDALSVITPSTVLAVYTHASVLHGFDKNS